MESLLSSVVNELMNEDSIGWSMKEWMRCVTLQLEEQGMEIPEDESFKSILKEKIMMQAAMIAPTQEETPMSSFEMTTLPETEQETAPQYEHEDVNDDDIDDDAEAVLNRKKTKKNRRKPKGKSMKRSRDQVTKRAIAKPAVEHGHHESLEQDASDDAGGDSPTRTDSHASDSELDSGDEVLDVRNIISTKGRSLRKEPQQSRAKPEMTYAEAVVEAQQKVISEEMQAVQSAERALTAAELHRKALIEMDEEEREEMADRLRAMALRGIRREVLPMLRQARRQVRT